MTVLLRPLRDLLQGLQPRRTVPLAALFDDHHQPAFRKDAHVLGDGGLADPEVLCYGIQRECLPRQQPMIARRVGSAMA